MYRKHKTELNVGVKVNTLVSHVVYLNFISPKGGLLKYSQVPPIEWHDGTDSQLITEPTTEQVQQPQVLIYIYIQTHTHTYTYIKITTLELALEMASFHSQTCLMPGQQIIKYHLMFSSRNSQYSTSLRRAAWLTHCQYYHGTYSYKESFKKH
jgi:hypothetical protein